MTDFDEIAVSTGVRLQALSQQAARLGAGLQNTAPAGNAGMQNPSIQYLISMADILKAAGKECIKLGPSHMQEPTSKS